ncbi:hypothetical protein BDQ12DRAFT_93371 [Crucibulum laeve]|uniref:Uncharacterized protein n=1 Tax=Crucibulum laeve TaxID=68775 RepID=A0A5C3LHQ0_9AGAR|nr:hypothetical protein BDQ12DRAFT_93371 [Crucibulum laeve]
MQRTSYLAMSEEPLDALCHHFNVSRVNFSGGMIPSTIDMPVLRDAHMPTHVLAVLPPDGITSPPLMLPIDAGLYDEGFRDGLALPESPPGTAAPVPRLHESTQTLIVTLPVVSLTVPHPASLPLLLLFGLGLETQPNYLAWRLLPAQVVGEFPNASAMAHVFSRFREETFEQCFRYTQGIWKNVLALGLKRAKIVELVHTAWNVTAEARRLRQRGAGQR